MGQPKRVWSNNKTVWDGKKSVWLQDGELKTYDGTWEKAEGQLSVYGNTWSNLSDDDELQVYDSSSATEIGTVEENQGDEPQPVPPTPEPESHTFTINVENVPEGANINGGIRDPQSGETLEEISVSSFPMEIEFGSVGGLGLDCNSHEGDGDISIDSFDEIDIVKQYEINIGCEGYKPLFEAVGFDLEDVGEGNYSGEISADYGIYSNVSMTISFTPVE